MKEFTITAKDGLELSCAIFENENPKALVQVIHGAMEHKGRYYNFCEFLCNIGFTVIVSDNRGHGKSINAKYFLGHFDSAETIVEDQYLITQYIKSLYPGKDLYLFGHSFGSLIARMYLQEHDSEIAKLVLTGTVFPISGAKFGRACCNLSAKLHRENSTKGLIPKCINNGTDSWVCANPYTIKERRDDPLVMSCKYTNAALRSIVDATVQMKAKKKYKCSNPDLPVLTANGKNDPFRGTMFGLQKTITLFNKTGYTHIFAVTYPEMKHEVINELEKAGVYSDIYRFLNG